MLLTYIKRLFRSKEDILREKKDVCYHIGTFLLAENLFDVRKTEEMLASLKITNLEVSYHRIFITLGEPGLLIGHRGMLLSRLETYLYTEFKRPIKIEVIEDEFINSFRPVTYSF
jgi:ribosomal protein S3